MKRLHSRLRSSASQLSPDGFAPASLALDFLGTSNTLDNRITFSRGSQATLTDSTGKLTYAPNNLLTNSESFEASSWIKSFAGTGLAPVVTANAAVAPDGTTTADLVVFDRGAGNAIADRSVLSQGPTVANTTAYTNSIYIKAATAGDVGKQIAFRGVAGAGYQVFTLTASWVRINLTETSISTTGNFELASRGTVTADNQVSVHIWGAQLEAVTYQTTPSTYNSTTPKNLLGYTQEFDNAAWTKGNAFVQTNLLLQSEAFDNASWTKTAATVTANDTAAPNGTITADKVVEDATTALHFIRQNPTVSAVAHTFSFYAKSAERTVVWASLDGASNTRWFDLSAGTTGGSTGNSGSSTITPVGGGWFRCTYTYTFTGTTSACFIGPALNSSTLSYAGNGTSGIFVWGAQLVQGSTAGDYQRTDAAAAAVQYTAPDGTFSADKLVENSAASAQHFSYQQMASLAASTYTYSIYVKAGERNKFRLAQSVTTGYAVDFDLEAVTATTAAGGAIGSITSIGNGWYRCSSTFTTSVAIAMTFVIYLENSSGSVTYTGDGTSGIYVWGAQLSNSASVDPYSYNPGAAPTSTAYYGPRFDYDPVTLQAKGLLIEEQRTNRTLQSGDFTAASWVATVVGTSTRVNDGAPLGFTRGLITATSATGGIRQIHSGLTSGQVYALSFYIQSTATSVQVVFENGTSQFGSPHNVTINPSNGTAGVLTGFTSVSIQPFGPGYVYTLITAAAGGALAANIEWRITNSGNSIWLGRPQFEAGAFATSYIPTVASTVTRSADIATMTGDNFRTWYNLNEGAFVVGASSSQASNNRLIEASSGTTSRVVDLLLVTSTGANVQMYNGTTTITTSNAFTVGSALKAAGAYNSGNYAVILNGGPSATNSATLVNQANALQIGRFNAGSNYLNGYIRSITYYPQRLPDYQLQRLTA